ncbi:carboxypeptidase-like regulatory domain-containing protein [Crocinitomix catalasitica]|nr:carboxypeptidase-like regulatory domain-containing protein [Crocinitomix catalasitica]
MRILLFFIFLAGATAYSQMVSGIVKDEFNNPLPFTKVVDTTTNLFTMTDMEGRYRLSAQNNSVFRFSYVGKKTQIEPIVFESGETLILDVKMVTSSTQLKVVEVTSERIKPVAVKYNHHILDYIFSGRDQFLVLKKIKRKRFLCVDGLDTTFAQFAVDVRVNRITVDCQQNIFLIGKDSAYQIYVENRINYISSISAKEYKKVIEPCIHEEMGRFYVSEYRHHNKTVVFYSTYKDGSSQKELLRIEDGEYRKTAEIEFREIMSLYSASTPESENIIQNGLWGGDVYELINVYTSRTFFDKVAFFKQQIAREIVCPRFLDADKNIIIFDHINDHILSLKDEAIILADFFDFHYSKYYADEILQDKVKSKYYAVFNQRGNLEIREIDTKSGETKVALKLDEIGFPELIKVNNGYLYFVKFQGTGFAKLYRVKIDE